MSIRHLKTRKQFQSMLAHPPIAKTSHFCVYRVPVRRLLDAEGGSLLFANPPDLSNPCDVSWWVGALLPKRWAKHAVTRNLIRRNVYAIALELNQRLADPAHTVCDDSQAQEPQAFLIRLRASFHKAGNKKSPSRKKSVGKKDSQQAGLTTQSTPAQAKPVLKSAASAELKSEVREQLLGLFTRATRPNLSSRTAGLGKHEAINPLKEAGQDA